MTKRLVDIDDDMLSGARLVLGTDTIKDTVNAALRNAISAAARRRLVDEESLQRFHAASADLADPDIMAGAWD